MAEYKKAFIETQFPVSKVSKESYKERMSNYSQTLTGLGKWWGRKPLILVRAALLGLLMPTSNDPIKDREVFLRLLTMDENGLWLRKNKLITKKDLFVRLSQRERGRWFKASSTAEQPKYKKGITQAEKEQLQYLVFKQLSYDEKLMYCQRPENIEGPSRESWRYINEHLNTNANSLSELVHELGVKQFDHVPRVGDAFCGGGSVPFEAARLGCEAYGSDLNPVATLLTWSSLYVLGSSEEEIKEIGEIQEQIFQAVNSQISHWQIENNELGWRADYYLYCNEAICPECKWKIPLAPSWVVGEKSHTIVSLVPIKDNERFELKILTNVSKEELSRARDSGTVKNSYLNCPNPDCKKQTSITMLRGDGLNTANFGIRPWQKSEFIPRRDDLFQERLYCIRWIEEYLDENGNEKIEKYYLAPDEQDLLAEEKILALLEERFNVWQERGIIPDKPIISGYNTNQPLRERGWTYWHQLFTPRQLLVLGCLFEQLSKVDADLVKKVAILLSIGKCCDYNAKLSRWHPHGANEKSEQVFSDQALNTLFNFASRSLVSLETAYKIRLIPIKLNKNFYVVPLDARNNATHNDFWITDPPYADAVNYHELSEFFLAWYEKYIKMLFPEWYTDSKRALAITGSDEEFRKSMVECYRNLTSHMPDNGAQIVMFTHQDAGVWADLALILWASGLQVSAAWCIATETDTALREGNYVQGTVLLVLRKQTSEDVAFLDDVHRQVEIEVRNQLDSMLALDDKEEPNFGDTDYQLAAYAAALRVLTKYKTIEEIDVAKELARPKKSSKPSKVEEVIREAVRIACDHLVPQNFDNQLWKRLQANERFYIKSLEMESHGEYRTGAYQELARGFGVIDYRKMLASNKANRARLKTATEFAARNLDDGGFGNTLVRHILFAVREIARTDETENGRSWLKNEIKDKYWDQRKDIIAILQYLAGFEHSKNMPHWHKDAAAARLLAGALENAGV